jgi:hypothetical protein
MPLACRLETLYTRRRGSPRPSHRLMRPVRLSARIRSGSSRATSAASRAVFQLLAIPQGGGEGSEEHPVRSRRAEYASPPLRDGELHPARLRPRRRRQVRQAAMIAALFVLADGPYAGRSNVEPWPESRDARLYSGPWPVVAHPPCARWGRYWSGGPNPGSPRRLLGDDGGCFAAALSAVRRFGGVLEHPRDSRAWGAFGLARPPHSGGWIAAGDGGFTCCVEQGHYGHQARKGTWLYAMGQDRLPELAWGPAASGVRLEEGFHSREEWQRAIRTVPCQRLSRRQRALTPPAFADLLIALTEEAQPWACRGELPA